ncbi:MAG: hypothetical protein IJN24_05700 [Bacteroidaceae bacterium]|nr:hypothetical protein [Bacteroidaceae bacterium]
MNYNYNKPKSDGRKEAVIEAFFRSMKKMTENNPAVTQREIVENAVKSSAPRFFTSYENARRLISLMIRKKRLPIANKNKIEMYKEIYRRFIKMSRENITRHGRYSLLEKIIYSPAPSFYMDCNTFQALLYKALRERNIYNPCISSINTDII